MRPYFVRLSVAAAGVAVALGLLLAVILQVQAAAPSIQPFDHGSVAAPAVQPEQTAIVQMEGGRLVLVSNRLVPISARRTISDPGLNTPLTLSENGRRIAVTGHVSCIKGDTYKIQTSLTQRATGALAQGETTGTCTGREEQFSAPTWVYDEALFAAGPAQACAVLTVHTNGKASDAFQWCRKEDATLIVARASY